MHDSIVLKKGTNEFLGFPQAALNGTEVEIKLECEGQVAAEFTVQYVIRSSPCDKEFFDIHRRDSVRELLNFYFDEAEKSPAGFHYNQIIHYKSKPQKVNCKESHGVHWLSSENPRVPMAVVNVTEQQARKKREAYPGRNGNTIDGGAKDTLSSWHPVQSLPMDGIYFLVLKFSDVNLPESTSTYNMNIDVQWRGPSGFLSAMDYPLLRFYSFMCFFYILLAVIWLVVCLKHWKDLLRIQYWIGAVIMIGMVEKALFLEEYSNMNDTGKSVDGLIEAAELFSCFKRTMSRVLIIIVSIGFGVVKPRLGSTMNQIAGVGFVYFFLCSIEGLSRVSRRHAEGAKQKQIAALPLVIVEVVIFYWIFTSLTSTMRTLRMRRNVVKLNLYRHFTNVMGFAMIASLIFMVWSLYAHTFQRCSADWKEMWVDTAFWHVLFCTILVVIMFLWRPSVNNVRYAFTPLLDDSEDENDDELFSSQAPMFDLVKQRSVVADGEDIEMKAATMKTHDEALEDDLKWIDNNIAMSFADHILADDEEEKERVEMTNQNTTSGTMHFDVDELKQRLEDGSGKRVRNNVATFFAGVVEHMATEVVRSAILAAIEGGHQEVSPRDVFLGIKLDEDLNRVFGNGLISGGGVLPNIEQALLMKPPRNASPLRVTHGDDSTKIEGDELTEEGEVTEEDEPAEEDESSEEA
uniref:Histone_H2A_C domain-containing protein n=1 Tax=Steinernema glaseri TaxID=37863 RepID=A0A1I7YBS3_9BILA